MKATIFYFTMSGNTELAAKELAEATGAPLVRLLAEPPYTVEDIDWTHSDGRCTKEHKDHSLMPRIKPFDVDISSLDTVFIGFPIWWHEEPAVIRSFLTTYQTNSKERLFIHFVHLTRALSAKQKQALQRNSQILTGKPAAVYQAPKQKLKSGLISRPSTKVLKLPR